MTLKTIAYTVLLMLISVSIHAAKLDEYQVEIVIFKQKNISVSESETFEKTVLIPNNQNSLSLPNFELPKTAAKAPLLNNNIKKVNYDVITAIHPASVSLIQLGGVKRSINRSSHYKILSHIAWRQLGLDNKKAKKIRITYGKAFVVMQNKVDDDVANIAIDYKHLLKQWKKYKKEHNIPKKESSFYNDDSPLNEAVIPIDLLNYIKSINLVAHVVYPLDGTIKVVRTRYLHMHTDLIWTVVLPKKIEPTNEETLLVKDDFNLAIANLKQELEEKPNSFIETLEKLNLQSYAFKAHRKMRSKKQHYIDHPKLGIATIIMPVIIDKK